MALAAGMFGAQIVSSGMMTRARVAMFFDDSQALRNVTASLVSGDLLPGEAARYWLTADKRADCYPPDGFAEVDYRVWFVDPDKSMTRRVELPYHRRSVLRPGIGSSLSEPSVVPLPELEPGCYALQWTGHYTCRSASAVQHIDGPLLPFRVRTDAVKPKC